MMLRLTWLPVVCIALLCVSTAGAKTASPLDAEQLQPVGARHADVADDQVGILLHEIQARRAVRGGQDLVAVVGDQQIVFDSDPDTAELLWDRDVDLLGLLALLLLELACLFLTKQEASLALLLLVAAGPARAASAVPSLDPSSTTTTRSTWAWVRRTTSPMKAASL